MTTIAKKSGLCTVIVTVDAEEEDMETLESHARSGLTLFAAYAGFVSGALHKSRDGRRLVQYLQWETEEHHLACLRDPAWEQKESSKAFMALVASGRATMDVRSYEVVESSNARS